MIDEKGNIQDWARKVDIEKRSEEDLEIQPMQ